MLKKKTDRETDGFKSSVKFVLTEIANLKKTFGKLAESNRRHKEAITYDSNGNRLTWKTYDYLTETLFEFDAKGNWTKRITSEGDKESKFVVKPREVLYGTLSYF